MSNPNPAADVAAQLAALSPYGTLTLAVDTNVFLGPERGVRAEVPPFAVFCLNLPGTRPEPYLGIDQDFHRYQVEVKVRSNPAQYQDGEDLARLILEQVQRRPPAGYVGLLVQQSGPLYLGSDEQRRLHRWTLVIELWWKG